MTELSPQESNSPRPEPSNPQPLERPPDQRSSGGWDKVGHEMLKLYLVPIFCYIPAFMLILMSFILFKPANMSGSDPQPASPEAPSSEPDLREGIDSLETSPLAREYIRTEIRNEVRTQVEQTTQDEIDRLKADLAGDLFGAIAFPVLFAIASIFVAFAIKDVLTEILKEQEKEKVVKELRRVLEVQIAEEIKVMQEDLTDRVETVEAYTNWLEHQLLDVMVNQVIDEIKGSENIEESELMPVRKLVERRNVVLAKISNEFGKGHFDLLRKIESRVIEAKVKSLRLSEETENDLLQSCLKTKNQPPEYRYKRMKSIFEMQRELCIATLHKLMEDADDSLKEDIQKWINEINTDANDLVQTAREKKQKLEKFKEEHPDRVSF